MLPPLQGPPGEKGDPGATEIIDYNGNIQEALQVRRDASEVSQGGRLGLDAPAQLK